MSSPNPCYRCIDRYPGCHGNCEFYNEWKNEHDAERKTIQNARKKDHGEFIDYVLHKRASYGGKQKKR